MRHLLSVTKWALTCLATFASVTAFAAATEVQILSATLKDQAIAGASITLQKNGEQSVLGTTGADGRATLNAPFADSAESLLIVKKPGYSNLVVKCPCAGMTYAISPVMTNLDGMRIVLNWGASPADLDSHILYPNNHVYFSSMEGTDAALDVDDTSSYGPETITVNRKHEGERYVYAVHDYSNGSATNSSALSNSGAKVFVYVGQTLVRTYYVPKNKKGNLWTAFAVTESGEFQDLNTIETVASEERLQTAQFQGVISNSHVQVTNAGADSKTQAKALNTQGETAFRAKNYDEAVRLFQEAIALDDNYGQAYSNLGLTFQQMGRVAEALWANRKAIALANGTTAATVRASSHYNNGRIYEAAGQWSDALREYRNAKQEKANTVYDNAIKRMQDKGVN
ncbi:MAG TPA: tetratricopeptide repeat protein [Cellvibrio sp.]|nr:tetratricopeptide repeat protein [Cellvibrio sp.]